MALLLVMGCTGAVRSRPASPPDPAAPPQDAFVDSILRLMTLEEKAGQLHLMTARGTVAGPRVAEGSEADIRAGRVGAVFGLHGAVYTREIQRVAVEESRLGIPLLLAHDIIHGFRSVMPVPIAEASSWDPVAVERSARIAAIESTAAGLHWTFAPMVDIARDARWGRIVEGSGEDPHLGAVLAAARVRGFQGTHLGDSTTMLATPKHFAAYGAAEGGRDYNTVDISDRTLHEVYLPPFEAAVMAGAGALMPAFNEIGGTPMHAHGHLLLEVLRERWGFDGLVVSDYTGIMELLPHGVAPDSVAAGVAALRAGVDMDIVSGIYRDQLPPAVRTGLLDERTLDRAVGRVLRAKRSLGLFEDPYRYSDAERERTVTLAPAHVAFARELARKSIVLLKNEGGLLPLDRNVRSVAVIGALADSARSALGPWAPAGRAEDAVTVLEGIRAAVGPATSVRYARGANVATSDTSGFPAALAAAAEADVVVLVLGEAFDMSGEAASRGSLDLPGVQQELLSRVHATGKPVVVVLTNGRPLTIPWLDEHIPAIVEAWYLGVQMGPAVADVLFGDYNPGGKLPVTFPRHVGQVPLYYNHKNTGRPPSERERYTSKYIDVPWTPLYPFGHGLSYTTFAYSQPRLSDTSIGVADSLAVSVDVTNTGQRSGDEVVQLYIRDEVASVTRPVRELRGFQRITLQPGESRTVSFTLGPGALSFPGPDLQRAVEPGFFTVWVGTSSADERQRARFEVHP